jgi:molybdate transport system substrate-binding protein
MSGALLAKANLIFYCGITMVKPMQEISHIIEKKYNCNIKIVQGGSKDLYDSLKTSKKGDIYLPGSDSYRKNNLKDGFLGEGKYVGYNQAAIFVKKGNPKHIKGLDDFLREDLYVVLGYHKSGSIGKMTKKILYKYKGEEFFEDVYDNAAEISTDSRNINTAIRNGADVAINWKATAFFNENEKYIDIIAIPKKYAPKKKLVLNLLTFSKHKDIVKAFMEFASSEDGQKIMKKYGFLDGKN